MVLPSAPVSEAGLGAARLLVQAPGAPERAHEHDRAGDDRCARDEPRGRERERGLGPEREEHACGDCACAEQPRQCEQQPAWDRDHDRGYDRGCGQHHAGG
jgi:hypothetical protein